MRSDRERVNPQNPEHAGRSWPHPVELHITAG
jgi:hypothetical protein